MKCQENLNATTVHCLVCDICYNNWDHHCFWLNTCIYDKNKNAFNVFYFNFMINVGMNFILILFSKLFLTDLDLIISFDGSHTFDNFFHNLFSVAPETTRFETLKLLWRIIFIVIVTIIIYSILYIIVYETKQQFLI